MSARDRVVEQFEGLWNGGDPALLQTSLAAADDGSVAGEGDGSRGSDGDEGEEPHDLLLRRLEIGCFFRGIGERRRRFSRRLTAPMKILRTEEDERRGISDFRGEDIDLGGEREKVTGFRGSG
ncbi:uncharacterized protein A4U43_C04F26210 [Asparagus officinalis]|uniref:Uncharacterized protein n=1 Tax=Asparagus officinalis TaxID=4686 RepID=A0A5P1F8D8_ASPOF|nr:uncharacterized protein A4U43_C04F26210 [Asparagus officinalis]